MFSLETRVSSSPHMVEIHIFLCICFYLLYLHIESFNQVSSHFMNQNTHFKPQLLVPERFLLLFGPRLSKCDVSDVQEVRSDFLVEDHLALDLTPPRWRTSNPLTLLVGTERSRLNTAEMSCLLGSDMFLRSFSGSSPER